MIDLSLLRRFPDVEAPNLFAVDSADRLILDESSEAGRAVGAGAITVIGDRYGALTLGAASAFGATDIRTHQDRLTGERALAANADRLGLTDVYRSLPLGADLLSGASIVLLQLPRTLAELDEIAETIARFARDDVVVFAGGRIKHLTLAMNEVLARYFDTVSATRARQKARVLVARGVRSVPDASTYPRSELHTDLGLTVCAHGGAFAGTSVDIGTRFLLERLDEPGGLDRLDDRGGPGGPDGPAGPATTPRVAIDLGCGTGILAARLALLRPELQVIATDQSASAVLSARATMRANALDDRVSVIRDDALLSQPNASADLVLCNPPFHVGSAVHTGVALALFRDAARVLVPGGLLFTVFNSHLSYQAELRRVVGSTQVIATNSKFTITVSTAR